MASVAREKPLRCVALRKDGARCQAFASTPEGVCIMHSERAAELHAKGGSATSSANRAAKLLPSRLRPMVQLLESVFAQLYSATGPRRTARDATALASVALAIGKLIQTGEMEERLRAVEQMAQDEGRFKDRRTGEQKGPIQWQTID